MFVNYILTTPFDNLKENLALKNCTIDYKTKRPFY